MVLLYNSAMLAIVLSLFFLQAQQPASALKDFEEWRSRLPADTTVFDLYSQYREHLKQKGMTEAEIRAAFRELEKDRWNRIYSGAPRPMFNPAPNAFLVQMVEGRKPGRALDVGVGEGRNAVFLAKAGWDVTGFDIAERGLELTRKAADAAGVKVRTINAAIGDFDFGSEEWDLIVGTYEGAAWHEKAMRGLKPGGIIVIEGFLRAPGTPPGASFGPNEVLNFFLADGLRILQYEDREGKPDFGPPGRVVRLCAQKPEAAADPAQPLTNKK